MAQSQTSAAPASSHAHQEFENVIHHHQNSNFDPTRMTTRMNIADNNLMAAAYPLIPQVAAPPQVTMASTHGHTMPLQAVSQVGMSPYNIMSYPMVSNAGIIPPGYRLVPIDGDNGGDNGRKKRSRDEDLCSFDDMILYPGMKVWLDSCDSHVIRGRDGENYAQYAGALLGQRFLRLDDFVELQVAELQAICGDMELGTARRLLHFAQKDVAKLKKEQRLMLHTNIC
jgi:hypothetical protein